MFSTMISVFFNCAALAALTLGSASAQTRSSVPRAFLGVWGADGRCGIAEDRLVITAATAALGVARPAAIRYAPDDDGAGHGALRWAAEGEVDNFVLSGVNGPLVHNAEGYGMPGQIVYRRCSD